MPSDRNRGVCCTKAPESSMLDRSRSCHRKRPTSPFCSAPKHVALARICSDGAVRSVCQELAARTIEPILSLAWTGTAIKLIFGRAMASTPPILKAAVITEGRLKALLLPFNPLHRKILEMEKCAFENPALTKSSSPIPQWCGIKFFKLMQSIRAKIEVIHNGVEWQEMEDRFRWMGNGGRTASGFKKFGLDPTAFHFLFIGNGYLRKGLISSSWTLSRQEPRFASLSHRQRQPDRSLSSKSRLSSASRDRVHFFGPSQEIRLFYQMADALVIPSFYDPFANVTVEALAMGLFVVSSKNNGGHEILTQENGAVIENLLDTDSIVQARSKPLLRHRKTMESAQMIARRAFSISIFPNKCALSMDELPWIEKSGPTISIRTATYPFRWMPYSWLHRIGQRPRHHRLLFHARIPQTGAQQSRACQRSRALRPKELIRIAKKSFQNLAINCLEYPKLAQRERLFPRHSM